MPSFSITLLCCLGFFTAALGSKYGTCSGFLIFDNFAIPKGDFVSKLEAAIAEGEKRGYDTGVSSLAVDVSINRLHVSRSPPLCAPASLARGHPLLLYTLFNVPSTNR